MTTILAIDTSSHRCIAVAACAADGSDERVLAFEAPRDHSHRLLPAIEKLLGAGLGGLERVVVVRGPGSFAGLRVGIATGRGLALARAVPLVGVGTLAAVAAAADGEGIAGHPLGRGEFAIQRHTGAQLVGAPEVIEVGTVGSLAGVAGEGAGELGGHEIPASERCLAALRLGRLIDAQAAATEAIYLRDPRITAPRAKRVSASV